MSARFPFPMPFGWFKVAYSHELKAGEARPIHYFDQELVLFRTESGVAKVLDAYCPHMGAHLGHGIHEFAGKGGEVRGETVVCPFHGWRFDGEGFCQEVPYAKNMPPKIQGKAALKAWPVVETNKTIYVWYHPQDKAPMWDVKEFDELKDPNWGGFDTYKWIIKSCAQEIVENAFDSAHFRYVHQTATLPNATMSFTGEQRYARQEAKMDTPRGQVDGSITIGGRGPAQAATRFSGICETLLVGHCTPIDAETLEVDFAFVQQLVNGEVPTGGVHRAIIADIVQQMNEDEPVWANKIYRDAPLLCDGDGPIAKFRKWFSQFYVGSEFDLSDGANKLS